ncbi:MAG: oligosaccharide flippase family protein [Marinilabiliaceae bacterium]|nr:oligosaccharide flippase family protein [Marinilabiliaceae bacterium]
MIAHIIRHKIVKGNLHALLGNMAQAIFGFMTFLLLVRHLDQNVFGKWVIFITVASLLDMLRLGFTGTAAIRLISTLSEDERPKAIGTSYQLSLISTGIIAVTLYLLYFGMHSFQPDGKYLFILLFYPVLSLANLAFHQANMVAQGILNFSRSTILKVINGAGTLGGVFIYLQLSVIPVLTDIILICILANAITSGVAMCYKWDGFIFIQKSTRALRAQIMQFGKYATAGYIGSNLLKSADTFILTLVPFLGPEAVAIYSIPLKFVEIVEIPLRSFSSAAFPQLTDVLRKNSTRFFQLLLSYTFFTTLMLVPVVLILLMFPVFFLQLMGGPEYVNAIGTQQTILYVICIYIILLPSDRYTGVALFAMNKPKQNFFKIMIMLAANVIFDLLAVLIFHSLIYIAVATLLFTAIGITIGWGMIIQCKTIDKTVDFTRYIVLIRKPVNGNSA